MAAGIKITIPVDPLIKLTRAAQVKLAAESKDLLDIMGTMLLGQVQTAYKVKARGGTAEDGISWEPIQARTLLARMRRAGHIKKVKPKATAPKARSVFKIAKSNADNNKAFGQMAKSGAIKPLSGGKGNARFKRGSQFQVGSQKKKADRSTISPSTGGYEIGVDSGLQINTLQPGRSGTAGANKTIEGNTVIVGASMSYSQYFDEDRPIIPDVLPDVWLKELEDEAERFANDVVETAMNQP